MFLRVSPYKKFYVKFPDEQELYYIDDVLTGKVTDRLSIRRVDNRGPMEGRHLIVKPQQVQVPEEQKLEAEDFIAKLYSEGYTWQADFLKKHLL